MAEYVTDTHPLMWYAGAARGHLSREASRIFRRCETGEGTVLVALNLGDFFDELIVGAARAHRLPLLTRDGDIMESGLVLVRW